MNMKNTIFSTSISFVLSIVFICGIPVLSYAACVNPSGEEGEIIYNRTYQIPQYCDDTNWIAMTGGGGDLLTSTTGGNPAQRIVFVTSTTTTGNIGGVVGADAICQARATAAGLAGRYLAWIADGDVNNSPAIRFEQSSVPYKRVDGVTVANNWADLTDGTLAAALNLSELGTAQTNVAYSNTNSDGTRRDATLHCTNFTAASGVTSGDTVNDTVWGHSTSLACNTSRVLYCFEQSPFGFTEVVPSGLIGHWRLDETSGTTAYDSSGNGHHAALQGNLSYVAAYGAPSPVGTAIEFDPSPSDSSGNRFQVSGVFPTGSNPPFSVAMWIKREGNWRSIWKNGPQGSGDVILYSDPMTIAIPSSSDFNTGVSEISDKWAHVTVTYNGSTLAIYKNGQLGNSTTRNITVSNNMFLFGAKAGARGNGGTDFDDVRLYNRALTAAEVSEIYNATDGIKYNSNQKVLEYFDGDKRVSMTRAWPEIDEGLVVHWKLDETSGTTAADATGNGHNGTLTNMTAAGSTTSGPVGNAMAFTENVNAHILIPHHNSLNINGQASFAFWLKRGNLNTINQVMNKGSGGYQIEFINSFFHLKQNGGSNNSISYSSVPLDNWNHVVITFDDNTNEATYFINGSFSGIRTITETMSSTSNLTLGRASWQKVEALDDVRIYNRLLSEEDAFTLYQMGSPVGQVTALPEGCPNIGDTCDDGTIYVGLSPDGNVPMFTTLTDRGNYPWNNGNNSASSTDTTMANCTGAGYAQSSCNTGRANTDILLTEDSNNSVGGIQPHQAAVACYNLNFAGASDWYLPAVHELSLLYTSRNLIGNFVANDYSSSSENNAGSPQYVNFSTGNINSGPNKGSIRPVRCVRKGPAPRCVNPYGVEGTMIYNTSEDVVQFCDGARWIGVGK